MIVGFTESLNSPRETFGSNARKSYLYNARSDDGSDTASDVRTHALANTDATKDGLVRDDITVEPNGSSKLWIVTIDYVQFGFQQPEADTFERTISTGTMTVNVKVAKSIIAGYGAAGSSIPDVGRLVNMTDEGVEGVDIEIPTLELVETWERAEGDIDSSDIQTAFAALKTWNNANFKGFAPGEVFFDNFNAAQRPDGQWTLTYKFKCLPNATDIVISDDITVLEKLGWDYLWTYNEKVESNGRIIENPIAAYVHRLYDPSSFASLGIGVVW